MTTHVGIDLSITSTAITIIRGPQRSMFSIVPNYEEGRSSFRVHEALAPHVKILSYERAPRTKENYVLDQSMMIASAQRMSELIASIDFGREPIINIEGFSFASSGASFIDLIMYNSFTRKALFAKYGDAIRIQSPATVKKSFHGKGNASKVDMVRTFCESEDELAPLFNDQIDWTKDKPSIPKPIDDLVDSYALARLSIEEEVNSLRNGKDVS